MFCVEHACFVICFVGFRAVIEVESEKCHGYAETLNWGCGILEPNYCNDDNEDSLEKRGDGVCHW